MGAIKDMSFAELREKLASDLLLIFLTLGFPLGIASTSRTFVDGDTSWHVAVGRWMVAHGRIPTNDPFSFTAFGKPWVAMEWPADLLFAGAFNQFGYAGLAALTAAAIMGLNAILLIYLRSRVAPISLTLGIIGMDVVLAPFMLARPHVLVWPILAAWTVLLAKSTETGKPPPLWSALLLVAWTNLHGSFPLATVIAAPLAFDALVKAKWQTPRAWLLFAGVSAVAICLNVNGLDGLLQPFRVAQLETLGLIQEWLPSTVRNTPQFYGALALVLGVMLWRGTKVPLGRLVLLLAMLMLAFSQLRHQSWFAIVAAALIPPLLSHKGAKAMGNPLPLLAFAVPLLAVRALWPMMPPEDPANPRSLIAAVPPELRSQPVFNEYTFGGPLILAGIKPYIDGRSEMYGDAFVTDYFHALGGDMVRFDRAVARYDIRWAMLPATSDLGAALEKSGKWKRIYADKVGAIYVREGGSTISERKAP